MKEMAMNHLKRFCDDDNGNATEYILIVTLTSITIAAGAIILGTGLDNLYHAIFLSLP
jgi:Flp pilus assembly pilin Flp